MDRGLQLLTLAAALGCALNAGVFFAFSAFVMRALTRLPVAQGITAMQSVNVTAVRPAFMTALFGTGTACVILAVRAVLTWGHRPAAFLLTGGALYLFGTIALTAVRHVPLNDALAGLDPHGTDAAARWSGYVRTWTSWNHLRAATALAAATSLLLALGA